MKKIKDFTIQEFAKLYSGAPLEQAQIRCQLIEDVTEVLSEEYKDAFANGAHEFEVAPQGINKYTLESVNYSHYCDCLGWPDMQDSGVFENVIDRAIKIFAWSAYGMELD